MARCHIVNKNYTNRTELAEVCDHNSSESETSSVTFAISVFKYLMSTVTVFVISLL